jgi:rubrerythrin
MTRDALIACDFSGGVLDGTDRGEAFIREALILKDMRRDYKLFKKEAIKRLNELAKTQHTEAKRVICKKCGRPQYVEFMGKNDRFKCPNCGTWVYNH